MIFAQLERKFLFILILSFLFLVGWRSSKRTYVFIRDHRFYVELATTPSERVLGLMFRKHLDRDKGMLFVFEEEKVYFFWMKNTRIPLDIIWINRGKEIVFISKDTRPCMSDVCPEINPGKKATYVLEVQGGISDKIGLAVGDRVLFDLR